MHDELAGGILQYDPFNSDDFRSFRDDVLASVAADDTPDPSTFKSPATEIREAEKRILEVVTREISEAKNVLLEAARGGAAAPVLPVLHVPVLPPPPLPAPPQQQQQQRERLIDRPIADIAPPQPRRAQDPSDVSTWRPKRYELPDFAKFTFAKLTTIDAFVFEYTTGGRLGRPSLKQIEKYFGPGRRRGHRPSWRSQELRGTQKHKVEWGRRKALYKEIDTGATVASLIDVVRNNNEELWEDAKNRANGKVVKWLMRYYLEARPGFADRRSKAIKRGETRRANIARRSGEATARAAVPETVDQDDGSAQAGVVRLESV